MIHFSKLFLLLGGELMYIISKVSLITIPLKLLAYLLEFALFDFPSSCPEITSLISTFQTMSFWLILGQVKYHRTIIRVKCHNNSYTAGWQYQTSFSAWDRYRSNGNFVWIGLLQILRSSWIPYWLILF